jgi:hypothetical protein
MIEDVPKRKLILLNSQFTFISLVKHKLMQKYTVLLICFFISFKLIAQQVNIIEYSQSISVDNIKKDVYELASEKMQGRETAEPGQKLAAVYIYKQFKEAGIASCQMKTDSLSYFQNFSIYKKTIPTLKLSINNKELKAYEDFSLTGFKNLKIDDIELFFLGTAPDSSYLNKDFSNKAVLFLTPNLFAGPVKALDIINRTNCNIVFYCNPTNPHQIQPIIQRQKQMFSTRQMLHPQKFTLKNPFDSVSHSKQYQNYNKMLSTYQGPISESVTAKILDVKVRNLRKYIAGTPLKLKSKNKIKADIELINDYLEERTENVIACIPGNEKKDEYIVISAHYDHIGCNGKKIFYGANDNASGTAAVIEIARKLKEAVNSGLQLKRSIVFAAFTGEEKGLLGSKYFVETNTFPHNSIKANLNIDMLGRKDKRHKNTNFVYLLGANDINPKLKVMTNRINNQYPKIELDYSYDTPGNFLYRASDQASFVDRGIPAIFYFNGLHDDYHKTTDTPNKIDYESIKKVSSLIFLTAIELANQE